MTRMAIAALTGAILCGSVAVPATAQSSTSDPAIAEAQRRLAAQIETVTSGAAVYRIVPQPDRCRTRVALVGPGETLASAYSTLIDWRFVRDAVATSDNSGQGGTRRAWMKITFTTSPHWESVAAPEPMDRAVAAAQDLIRLCRGVPRAP